MMARGAVRGNTFFSGALLGSDSGCKAPSKGQHRGSSDIVGQSFIFLGTPAFFLKKKRINKTCMPYYWQPQPLSGESELKEERTCWPNKRRLPPAACCIDDEVCLVACGYPFVCVLWPMPVVRGRVKHGHDDDLGIWTGSTCVAVWL